ncbi:MAG: M23 family metallopeptidase [Deltaproteobacteria bacterium]|nr:M23 family metallopeptidase [Deltaproteobacteria bacterium]
MKRLFIILAILILIGVGYGFFTFFERTPPIGEWQNYSDYLGREAVIKLSIMDKGQGLKKVDVAYKAKRNGHTFPLLYSKDYSDRKATLKQTTFEVPLDFKKLGIEDGEGIIAVSIQDRSFWNFGRGNTTRLEYSVVIDTKPPVVELLSTDHVVLQGGTEISIYRTSSDTATTGIKVGGYFFPGHKGLFKDKDTYLAFFSYAYNLPPGEPIFIVAEDRAGNGVKKGLPILVKPKIYKNSTIRLTDSSLQGKIPEVLSFAGIKETGDPLKDFLLVNKELRGKNEEEIKAVTKDSASELLWKGGFLQLKNAKVEANFADFRAYIYNDRVIDKQYHLGYDLAVTKRYPITASNNGKVIFAGNLGIYGNTVIIDHGFGIFTLYGHMSSIDVKQGDRVKKGAIIGRTGETGLAGGDHLHFGVFIHGLPVIPVEWWDEKWVEDRILRRIREAGG